MFTDVLVNLSLCALRFISIAVSSKVMFLVIFMQSSSVVFWVVMHFVISLLCIYFIFSCCHLANKLYHILLRFDPCILQVQASKNRQNNGKTSWSSRLLRHFMTDVVKGSVLSYSFLLVRFVFFSWPILCSVILLFSNFVCCLFLFSSIAVKWLTRKSCLRNYLNRTHSLALHLLRAFLWFQPST